MDAARLRSLLVSVAAGEVPIEEAMVNLRDFPLAELPFAKLDTHRAMRTGYPEVVFGQSKTAAQIAGILERMLIHHDRVLATRIEPGTAEIVLQQVNGLRYHEQACAITAGYDVPPGEAAVAVLCAGTADIPVAAEATLTVEMRGIAVKQVFDVGVAGIHRLLEVLPTLERVKALVVVAGMEGALPSVVAGLVARPTIAVPTSVGYGASFGGLAPLLTMLTSCAAGIAVVNIDNGFGAGYLAGLIAARSLD